MQDCRAGAEVTEYALCALAQFCLARSNPQVCGHTSRPRRMEAIRLVAFLFFATPSLAIVCRSDFCNRVTCSAELTRERCASDGGRFVENGGVCGCCPNCIVQLAEGQPCSPLRLRGLPPTSECSNGLVCDPKGAFCTKKSCAALRQELSASHHEPSSLPNCAENGTFAPMQCSDGRCYCVEIDGTTIQNTSVSQAEAEALPCNK